MTALFIYAIIQVQSEGGKNMKHFDFDIIFLIFALLLIVLAFGFKNIIAFFILIGWDIIGLIMMLFL